MAGIDAGGTGVRIRIVDCETGQIRAEASGPSAADGGPDPAVALLRNAGGVPDALCAGITKVSRAGVVSAWRDALRAAFPEARVQVEPDYRIAVIGALSGGDGVLILAGTGSVAVARRGDTEVRVGGRGWEYGDEGSGAHVTADALRRTLRALDGVAPETPLSRAIASLLGSRDAGAAAEQARRAAEREGRGFLIPLILERARDGDTEAADLFTGAAGWLARLSTTAARRAGFASSDPTRVVHSGGLWSAGSLLRDPFERVVVRTLPQAHIGPVDGSALDGAVALARRSLASGTSEG